MHRFKALFIGKSYELTTAPLPLLKRANFEMDLISFFGKPINSSSFENVFCIHSIDQLIEILPELLSKSNYDLVVIGDDEMLADILKSKLSLELKQQILPITSPDGFEHLYSKIGLSKTLRKSGITTPDFWIAQNEIELFSLIQNINYPFIIKIDSSGGGGGVFQCNSPNDVVAHSKRYVYPLLIQEFIEGDM